jgi:hypothetical protein
MEKKLLSEKNQCVDFNYKSPLLFKVPLDVYSDEVGKDRNRESFLRLKKISEKCEQLREKFHSYTQQHSARIEITRNLILQTLELSNNNRLRKNRYLSEL